jgi:nucleoside-diphosphate-sugar epimerase
MKVFVAGATGALGIPVVRQLVAEGHEPRRYHSVRPRRPHLVTNAGGSCSATFLVLQGIGEYDYVPLV